MLRWRDFGCLLDGHVASPGASWLEELGRSARRRHRTRRLRSIPCRPGDRPRGRTAVRLLLVRTLLVALFLAATTWQRTGPPRRERILIGAARDRASIRVLARATARCQRRPLARAASSRVEARAGAGAACRRRPSGGEPGSEPRIPFAQSATPPSPSMAPDPPAMGRPALPRLRR